MPHARSPSRRSRRALRAAAVLVALAGARASAGAPAAALPALPSDPVLEELVAQSLAARPELRGAEAALRAERERVPQAGALPDPVLSLGIQNDGFDAIQVGEMETSFYQVMLSQGLPWPGKRGLRTEVARLAADEAAADLARARLGAEGDVRRAYTDLLLARDRLRLLAQLEEIWHTSSGVARSRYEAGEGAQSDVLRAQLELNRLRQRRWSLEAQERTAVQTLNRLRARPLDEPIATASTLRTLADPALGAPEAALEDALARSPELARARLQAARAGKAVALARRERYPDLAVEAGIMPRGDLDPMWLAGISVGLPLWSGRKQGRAVAEGEARADGGARAAEAVEQVVRLRVAERAVAHAAVRETIRLFREGLLVQSRATADSTLAQYRVGKVTFASVLDANAGYIDDEESYLAALAEGQRIAIAALEVSPDPVGVAGASGAMATGGVPGVGASGAGGGGAGAGPTATGAAASAPGGMGGM